MSTRHIVGNPARGRKARWLSLPALLLAASSCINEYPDDYAPGGTKIGLALTVALADTPTGDEDDAASNVERMHDLRVIITRREGNEETLEYNRHIDLSDSVNGCWKFGYLDSDSLRFTLPQAGPYHLYLFANCDTILAAGLKGKDGSSNAEYLKALKEVTYTNEQLQACIKGEDGKGGGLPMCSEYDVDVEATSTIDEPTVKECLIVRAANKITLRYINGRQHPIFVQNWSLASVADKAYLLPHVDEMNETNTTLFSSYDGWIDWYEKHIASHQHPSELEFSVPTDAKYHHYNGISLENEGEEGKGKDTYSEKSDTIGEEGETITGLKVDGYELVVGEGDGEDKGSYFKKDTVIDEVTYYFPETRYVPENGESNGKQKYTMDFKTKEYKNEKGTKAETESSDDYKEYTYTGVELPDVTTLFRNTHVKITAVFREGKESQVELHVSIINWNTHDYGNGDLVPDGGGTEEENE